MTRPSHLHVVSIMADPDIAVMRQPVEQPDPYQARLDVSAAIRLALSVNRGRMMRAHDALSSLPPPIPLADRALGELREIERDLPGLIEALASALGAERPE